MKKEIIAAMRAKGLTETQAEQSLTLTIDAIAHVVRTSGKAAVPGFGIFKRKHRASRTIINPRTREPMTTQDRTVLGFSPSSTFQF
jgi:nucleoid DNA-binding protein